jgi:RimJ/RimL family protein N-acetyltransferase
MKGNGIRPKSLVAMFNELFGLLFGKLRVARVTGLVRGSNARCKKIIERFGFKLEGVMREALPTDDLHVYGMLAGEYKTHDWYRG